MKRRNNKIRQINMGPGVKVNTSHIGRYNKKFFCTGDNKNNILIWAFGEEDPIQSLLPNNNQALQTEVSALTFTIDQNGIVSGSNRGIINIWDLQTAKISCTLRGHSTSVNCFTTFPNEQIRLASGSYDTNIKLWDLKTKNNTITLKGHTKQVNTLDISPDSKLLVSGSEDGTVKLWDLRYPEKLITTYTDHSAPVNCVKFNPQDIMFASAGADRTAKYFQCEPGMYVHISTTQLTTSAITAIEFSEDGNLLYTACNDSLRAWKMGKDGMLVDSIDSSWKGVQDLCMIQNDLVGIAFHAGNLSFWAHRIGQKENREQQKSERQKVQRLPNIRHNRSQQVRDVQNNIKEVMNIVNNIQIDERFKKNNSYNNQTKEKVQKQKETPKRNFLQQLQKKKLEEIKRMEEQKTLAEQARVRQQKQRVKKQEERIRRQKEQKERKQKAERQRKQQQIREQQQSKKIQIQRRQDEIAQFNKKMAQKQQTAGQVRRLQESILYEDQLDATINASQFMIDEGHKEKFKQYDMISQLLKDSGKFTTVVNVRMSRVKPIINWWSNNNIKSAIYALSEADISVALDALNAIFSNSRLKSLVTVEVAVSLCRKAAEIVLDNHAQYVKNGISIINEIVLMYKDELLKIKNFMPGAKVDLSREDRIAKYDRLIQSFDGVFKIQRIVKYAKASKSDPNQEVYQQAAVLHKNLQQILRKWTPKKEADLV